MGQEERQAKDNQSGDFELVSRPYHVTLEPFELGLNLEKQTGLKTPM